MKAPALFQTLFVFLFSVLFLNSACFKDGYGKSATGTLSAVIDGKSFSTNDVNFTKLEEGPLSIGIAYEFTGTDKGNEFESITIYVEPVNGPGSYNLDANSQSGATMRGGDSETWWGKQNTGFEVIFEEVSEDRIKGTFQGQFTNSDGDVVECTDGEFEMEK
ncbi:MAG: hypothetical protein GYB31_05695 [Bacteroidetes bacterium]|nr:hypothetical protein [Bacteroidota bacterium]